ncbi:MAG: glycosyltransferase family 2 protein [Bacteroidia bacterium]|nr:glycosyltransferase family 2 protein [Bacteroidia bacterium]
MQKISAVIITMNEEQLIEQCLQSLDDVADEVIVVDSFSTDSTEQICKKYNVKFVQHEFKGFMDQKNYASSLASHPYIFSLDADEVLSEELQKSILEVKNNIKYEGYTVNRLSRYCGQWIRHSAWYPDPQLRLFKADRGNWGLINVHERFIMNHDSRISKLKGDLLHFPCKSEDDLAEKIEKYSNIAATEFYEAGKRAWFTTPAFHMIWRFFQTYFIRLGFLDGKNGFVICKTGAYSSFLKYSKLRKLAKEENKKSA